MPPTPPPIRPRSGSSDPASFDWIDDLSDDELSAILSPEPAKPEPETPATLGEKQQAAALVKLHEDASRRFRFPVASLDALAGSVGYGELWTVGGRQGNGKSLFAQNMAAWLLDAGRKTLYLGTEQDAATLKVKQACVMAGVNHKLMLKPTPEQQASDEYARDARAVQEMLAWLSAEPQVSALIYGPERYISRRSLQTWVERSVGEWGVEVVILDHIHHMQHGDGRNPVSELTETVHAAKGMAVDFDIAMIAFSQITRTNGDPIKAHSPPAAEDFAGASAIERTSDVMLGVWRPLRLDLDAKTVKEMRERAKLGQTAENTIYEPFTMGVRCVKDRLGDAPGTQTMLAVTNQRITERGRDAYATDYESLKRFGRPL